MKISYDSTRSIIFYRFEFWALKISIQIMSIIKICMLGMYEWYALMMDKKMKNTRRVRDSKR